MEFESTRISWKNIFLTAFVQTILFSLLLKIIDFAPGVTDWVAIVWSQEAAGWAAAITTVAAVVVALDTSRRAEATSIRIREDERAEAEKLRARKEKALSAAIEDELNETLRGLRREIERMGEEPLKHATVKKAFLALAELESPFLFRSLDHLEAFSPDLGAVIAAAAARLRSERKAMAGAKDLTKVDPTPEEAERMRKMLKRFYNRYLKVYLAICKQASLRNRGGHEPYSLAKKQMPEAPAVQELPESAAV